MTRLPTARSAGQLILLLAAVSAVVVGLMMLAVRLAFPHVLYWLFGWATKGF